MARARSPRRITHSRKVRGQWWLSSSRQRRPATQAAGWARLAGKGLAAGFPGLRGTGNPATRPIHAWEVRARSRKVCHLAEAYALLSVPWMPWISCLFECPYVDLMTAPNHRCGASRRRIFVFVARNLGACAPAPVSDASHRPKRGQTGLSDRFNESRRVQGGRGRPTSEAIEKGNMTRWYLGFRRQRANRDRGVQHCPAPVPAAHVCPGCLVSLTARWSGLVSSYTLSLTTGMQIAWHAYRVNHFFGANRGTT